MSPKGLLFFTSTKYLSALEWPQAPGRLLRSVDEELRRRGYLAGYLPHNGCLASESRRPSQADHASAGSGRHDTSCAAVGHDPRGRVAERHPARPDSTSPGQLKAQIDAHSIQRACVVSALIRKVFRQSFLKQDATGHWSGFLAEKVLATSELLIGTDAWTNRQTARLASTTDPKGADVDRHATHESEQR